MCCRDSKSDFSVNVEVVKCAPHMTSTHDDTFDVRDDDELGYLELALRDSDFVSSPDSNVPRIDPRDGVSIMTSFADNARRSWRSVDVTNPDSGILFQLLRVGLHKVE